MFSKDPKKTTIDPVSIVKDEAVNQVKNKVQSKVNELVSSKVQKAAALAQQGGALVSTAASMCSGQLKLATVLEFFRYWFSDSFGG
ncbi:hypothetical protein AB7W92_22125, partial [Providencia rettgeri]